MRIQHILSTSLLLGLTFGCSNAFAQYKIEELSEWMDALDQAADQVMADGRHQAGRHAQVQRRQAYRVTYHHESSIRIVNGHKEINYDRSGYRYNYDDSDDVSDAAYAYNYYDDAEDDSGYGYDDLGYDDNLVYNYDDSDNYDESSYAGPSLSGGDRVYSDVPHEEYSSYALLDNVERVIYDALYPAIENAEWAAVLPDSVLSSDIVSSEAIGNAVEAIRLDHPEFVWLDNGYNLHYTGYAGQISNARVEFYYNSLASDPQKYKREFEAAAEALLNRARQKRTLLEMEEYIYDYLQREVRYEGTSDKLDQTGYAALVMKACVCGGFAITFNYLMRRLGIVSYYRLGEDHAWNVIYLNGRWYNVDSTATNGNKTAYQWEAHKKDYFNRPVGEYFWKRPDDVFPNNRLPI